MKIAVDAMGGDNAPKAIVEGVMLAKKEYPDTIFSLLFLFYFIKFLKVSDCSFFNQKDIYYVFCLT